jgi:SAM-dependent methyltransferase
LNKYFLIQSTFEEQIEQSIEKEFKQLNNTTPMGYLFVGDEDDYCFDFPGLYVESMLKSIAATRQDKEPLQILDIGCGLGTVVEEINNGTLSKDIKACAYGITAFDFRKMRGWPESKKIFLGDAHHLNQIPELSSKKFDLIVSKVTFAHLLHPLKGLIEAYNMLKEDGVFICDDIPLMGLERWQHIYLYEYLRKNGYKLITFAYYGEFSKHQTLIIQKTKEKPHLELPIIPIKLEEKTGKVIYGFKKQIRIENIIIKPPASLIQSIQKSLAQLINNNSFFLKEMTYAPLAQLLPILLPLTRYSLSGVRQALKPKLSMILQNALNIRDSYALTCLGSIGDPIPIEDAVNSLIILIHRDILFHRQFINFRKELLSADLPIIKLSSSNLHIFSQYDTYIPIVEDLNLETLTTTAVKEYINSVSCWKRDYGLHRANLLLSNITIPSVTYFLRNGRTQDEKLLGGSFFYKISAPSGFNHDSLRIILAKAIKAHKGILNTEIRSAAIQVLERHQFYQHQGPADIRFSS